MTGSNLATALAAFQADLPAVLKTETATVEKKSGGSFKYTYADLAKVSAIVLPKLGAVGLAFVARPMVNAEGRFVLAYSLIHVGGDRLDGEYPIGHGTHQEIGSAITYARRYALCSVTGVAPADDDDDAAEAKDKRPTEAPPREFDPAEQQMLFDAWSDEIAKAKTGDDISAIGKSLLAGKRGGDISPNTYAKLAALGGRRKAEIDAPQPKDPSSD